MSKLKKESLDKMINNALNYKQDISPLNKFFNKVNITYLKPKICFLAFISAITSYIFISPTIISRDLANSEHINNFITLTIIEDDNF